MDLDDVSYGIYTIGVKLKNMIFLFPANGNTNMAEEQTCEVRSTLAPHIIGPCNDDMVRFLENTRH